MAAIVKLGICFIWLASISSVIFGFLYLLYGYFNWIPFYCAMVYFLLHIWRIIIIYRNNCDFGYNWYLDRIKNNKLIWNHCRYCGGVYTILDLLIDVYIMYKCFNFTYIICLLVSFYFISFLYTFYAFLTILNIIITVLSVCNLIIVGHGFISWRNKKTIDSPYPESWKNLFLNYTDRSSCIGFLSVYFFISKINGENLNHSNKRLLYTFVFSRVWILPLWVLYAIQDFALILFNTWNKLDLSNKDKFYYFKIFIYEFRKELCLYTRFTHNDLFDHCTKLKIRFENKKLYTNPIDPAIVREIYKRFLISKLFDHRNRTYDQLLNFYLTVNFRGRPHLATTFITTEQYFSMARNPYTLSYVSHWTKTDILRFINSNSLIGYKYQSDVSKQPSYNYNTYVVDSVIARRQFDLMMANMGIYNRLRILSLFSFQYIRGLHDISQAQVQLLIPFQNNYRLTPLEEAIVGENLKTSEHMVEVISTFDQDVQNINNITNFVLSENNIPRTRSYTTESIIEHFTFINSDEHLNLFIEAQAIVDNVSSWTIRIRYDTDERF